MTELEKKKFIADMEQKNLMAQEMKHELAKRAVVGGSNRGRETNLNHLNINLDEV